MCACACLSLRFCFLAHLNVCHLQYDGSSFRLRVSPHLQCDVGLRPVLHVLKLNIGVSVDEIDADQLLTALTLEARQTLTDSGSRLLLAGGAVLTRSQLAERRGRKGHLTKLTAEEEDERESKITLHPLQRLNYS